MEKSKKVDKWALAVAIFAALEVLSNILPGATFNLDTTLWALNACFAWSLIAFNQT